MKYLLAIVTLLFSFYVDAQIYQCTSESGSVSFQSRPCSQEDTETIVKKDTDVALSNCDYPILGLWTLTHVTFELDEDLLSDDSRNWTFNSNGEVHFEGVLSTGAPVSLDIPFQCDNDVITVNGVEQGQAKIIRFSETNMVWEDLTFGGYIYVER